LKRNHQTVSSAVIEKDMNLAPKQIVDRAGGTPPLLFLLDEILHGTNSHDRRIGAEAILRGLVARGAIGLVTTHDLTLAEIPGVLQQASRNVHFTDATDSGGLDFDYKLKPGIAQTSNGLAILAMLGID